MRLRNKKILLLPVILLGLCVFIWLNYLQIGALLYRSAMWAESHFYGFTEKQLAVKDISLSYYENRNANTKQSTLVLLHGFTSDKDIWLRFAKHFVADYRVLIIDVGAHGQTPYIPNLHYDVASQASRVIDFLHKLGVQQYHIAGNSMGGAIAAWIAYRQPQSVLSLLMIDPAGLPAPKSSDLDKLLAQGINPFLITNKEEFERFYPLTMAQPPWVPKPALDYIAQLYQKRKMRWQKLFAELDFPHIFNGELAQIKAPSLLMWGAKDRLLDISLVPIWQQRMANLQVKIWQDVGHMAMIEIATKSAAFYKQFLDENQIFIQAD